MLVLVKIFFVGLFYFVCCLHSRICRNCILLPVSCMLYITNKTLGSIFFTCFMSSLCCRTLQHTYSRVTGCQSVTEHTQHLPSHSQPGSPIQLNMHVSGLKLDPHWRNQSTQRKPTQTGTTCKQWKVFGPSRIRTKDSADCFKDAQTQTLATLLTGWIIKTLGQVLAWGSPLWPRWPRRSYLNSKQGALTQSVAAGCVTPAVRRSPLSASMQTRGGRRLGTGQREQRKRGGVTSDPPADEQDGC